MFDSNAFLLSLASSFLLATFFVWVVRVYSQRRRLIDIPNERSSHVNPTPTGGGVGFVIAVFLVFVWCALSGAWGRWGVPSHLQAIIPVCGGAIVMSAIGFIDDHRHLAALPRLFAQIFISFLCVLFLFQKHGMLGGGGLLWSMLPVGFAIGIAWIVNLYNFMDGIDGLAAMECVTASFIGGGIAYLSGQFVIAAMAGILGAACMGFLIWNWPPARIFMGDAGSYFLGFFLGALWLASSVLEGGGNLWWIILLGVFIVDATFTLLWRMIRGERFYAAHRNHSYQIASRRYSHRTVVFFVLGVNLFWLAPLAYLSARVSPAHAYALLVVAYLPLLGVCIWIKRWRDVEPNPALTSASG